MCEYILEVGVVRDSAVTGDASVAKCKTLSEQLKKIKRTSKITLPVVVNWRLIDQLQIRWVVQHLFWRMDWQCFYCWFLFLFVLPLVLLIENVCFVLQMDDGSLEKLDGLLIEDEIEVHLFDE